VSILAVPPGASLQTALNAAKPGDEIVLTAGARYVVQENVFPLKASGTAHITIRSSSPLPDRRITPADAPLLPIITSGHAGTPFNFKAGTSGWILDGLKIEGTSAYYIDIRGAESIVLDRLLIQAPGGTTHRAIAANGRAITLKRSHIDNVWLQGNADTQAFCAWDAPGPFTVQDNFLEASGENVMFGGANSSSPANIPSDILVEGNTIQKRLEWKGQARGVKNLFELKSARRVIVRNNTFKHHWTDAQNGYAILFTVRNDEGGSPWAVVEDVTFEGNSVTDVEHGVNILGYDSYQASGRTTRITVKGNTFAVHGRVLQMGAEIGEVAWLDNTVTATDPHLLVYSGSVWTSPSLPKRPALFAVEKLTLSGGTPLAKYADMEGFPSGTTMAQAVSKYIKTLNGNVIGGDPIPDPIVIPPPPPPPPDPVAQVTAALEQTKTLLAETQTKLQATEATLAKTRAYLSEAPDTRDAKVLARYLRALPK
jgi:hypothetical protein